MVEHDSSRSPIPGSGTALDWARYYVARDLRPFPVPRGSKRFSGKEVRSGWATMAASTPTDAMLRFWFPDGEPRNIGIGCRGSGLAVIDEDAPGEFARLCAAHGQPVPDTYRTSTSPGRWQHWFREPSGTVPNRTDVAAYDIDVRGPGGDTNGGYVIAPGSVHPDGHEYLAVDPYAVIEPMPEWLAEWARSAPSKGDTERATTEPRDPGDRSFTRAAAQEYIQTYAIEPLENAETGHRNDRLNNAALVMGHFAGAFGFDQDTARARLERIATVEKLAEDDGWDSVADTIDSGWRRGISEPYARQTEAETDGEIHTGVLDPPPEIDAAERLRRLVATEVERLEIRELAVREMARRRRGERPSIASGVIDDLDEIAPPAMLLGSLIPEAAVGILSGRSGSYKSFLGAAWSACIATGRAWLDRPEFTVSAPRKGLYVAAEGPRGAAGRLRAWEAATGLSRAGKLLLYPRPIRLNDPDQAEELAEYVEANGIGFVTIDTLRVSTPGSEENSSTDWGAAFSTMTTLRDDHGCDGLLIDHSGHVEDWRPRGTSAKITDPDYLISVTYDGAGAGPEAQRQLTVRKLKDDEVTGDWPIVLRPVAGQKFPVVDIGRVGELGRFVPAGRWWEPEATHMPEDVRDLIATGPGSAAARDIWRVLRWVDSPEGLSQSEIRRNLKEKPMTDGGTHGSTSIDRAFVLLVAQKIVSKHPTTGRYTLTDRGRNGTPR